MNEAFYEDKQRIFSVLLFRNFSNNKLLLINAIVYDGKFLSGRLLCAFEPQETFEEVD